MAFNDKLNKSDLDFLDSLYQVAKKSGHIQDWMYYRQQVELLIGNLDSPEEWHKYLQRIETIYGHKKGDKHVK